MFENACLVILALLLIYIVMVQCGSTRENFSARAEKIYEVTKPLYDEKGKDTTYSEFKVRLEPAIDAVGVDLFADTKNAYIKNPLAYSAESIESIITA
jgi:hypothetical protein